VSVKATIVFWRDGKTIADWGTFDFVQLPRVGEKIVVCKAGGLSHPDGTEDEFEVLKVEHFPAAETDEAPAARLLVEWISGRAG
jgi:hypothetical protein